MFVRVEVATRPEFSDPKAQSVLRKIEFALPSVRRNIRWARMLDVYWIEINEPREKIIPAITEIFWDPVTQWLITGDLIPSAGGNKGGVEDILEAAPHRSGNFWGLERRFRAGVTDNTARTVLEALEIILGKKLKDARAASGQLLLIEGKDLSLERAEETLSEIACEVFCNELIESWTLLRANELITLDRFHPDIVRTGLPRVRIRSRGEVETYELEEFDEKGLAELSQENLWALSKTEMLEIREHFKSQKNSKERQARELSDPTDVELEVLAQTWSEHCKHKIFNARIQYESKDDLKIPAEIESLFKETVRGPTLELNRPWLLSVFHDNAGVVEFDETHAMCIKVETHNSPSALDPYGGALTGIVGVNRDILGCGRGARPVFNTDVFCLAEPSYNQNLPEGILHPRRILDGVRSGVEDGGNKSGIPTVNGALVFDPRYIGKPLIYCGTGGIMPRKIDDTPIEEKKILKGDLICMVGGRIGKDGIHGATFSSLALDENSPTTAVQLGDPITQRRMTDFLMEARDAGLYRTLTDNGAGGLSSSVGELSQLSGGARMDVAKAATKYPGLKPFELVVSESQERMTVAVPPENHSAFLDLAKRRAVEVSTLGEFTDHGYFEILYESRPIALLDLKFLHEGVPKLELKAVWPKETEKDGVKCGSVASNYSQVAPQRLLDLLSRPNIASKEWLIRQYDHEVQGASVIKPLHTASPGTDSQHSGPNDAGVIKPKPDSWMGMAVGCGINPKLSDLDPYFMAQSAVDEAVRNVLCVGAEYGNEENVLALVDNYCWPDPLGDSLKAAQLVRACYGMKDAASALRLPFVSGKDSMKNDYRRGDVKISVPPTLLVTALGRLQDIRMARSSDFKRDGDRIYLYGGHEFGLLGTELQSLLVDRLVAQGGNEKQVVIPIGEGGEIRMAKPNWDLARKSFSWLGFAEGKRHGDIKSVHDVSEGGVLVALSEGLLARGFGANIELPAGRDPWEWSFGEGFHSFVVTTGANDYDRLEEEWERLGIPFTFLGNVSSSGMLKVKWAKESFSLSVGELRAAWIKEGYWQ